MALTALQKAIVEWLYVCAQMPAGTIKRRGVEQPNDWRPLNEASHDSSCAYPLGAYFKACRRLDHRQLRPHAKTGLAAASFQAMLAVAKTPQITRSQAQDAAFTATIRLLFNAGILTSTESTDELHDHHNPNLSHGVKWPTGVPTTTIKCFPLLRCAAVHMRFLLDL